MNERMWKIGCLWILGTSLTLINETNAVCTPTPDCASMGYTETSCEGDSLKCPFDISKLYCIPCDSSFKYDCTGANITGGVVDYYIKHSSFAGMPPTSLCFLQI